MRRSDSKRRDKPCSECGAWFTPHPRLGDRQRTCGKAACRRAQKRRTQRAWSARNPGYWTERRLREQAERLGAGGGGELRGPPLQLRQLPMPFAQDVIGTEPLVIIIFLARMLHRSAQDAIRSYQHEIAGVFDRMHRQAAQAEKDRRRRPP